MCVCARIIYYFVWMVVQRDVVTMDGNHMHNGKTLKISGTSVRSGVTIDIVYYSYSTCVYSYQHLSLLYLDL